MLHPDQLLPDLVGEPLGVVDRWKESVQRALELVVLERQPVDELVVQLEQVHEAVVAD